MREVLDRAIGKVAGAGGVGQNSGAITLERRDRSRPAASNLLIGEAHPHWGVWVDAAGVWQVILLRGKVRQAHLHKHGPHRRVCEQPVESWRGHRRAIEAVTPL